MTIQHTTINSGVVAHLIWFLICSLWSRSIATYTRVSDSRVSIDGLVTPFLMKVPNATRSSISLLTRHIITNWRNQGIEHLYWTTHASQSLFFVLLQIDRRKYVLLKQTSSDDTVTYRLDLRCGKNEMGNPVDSYLKKISPFVSYLHVLISSTDFNQANLFVFSSRCSTFHCVCHPHFLQCPY